jgi:hypothetical protein
LSTPNQLLTYLVIQRLEKGAKNAGNRLGHPPGATPLVFKGAGFDFLFFGLLLLVGRGFVPLSGIGNPIDDRERPRAPQLQDSDALRGSELQTKQSPKGKEAEKKRKPRRHKWLELAQWHNKQDGATEKGNGSGNANSAGTSNAKSEKANRAPELAPPPEKIHAEPAGRIPSCQVELLPMEDIYRVNGVMNPWKGYSINKIVEMLRNEQVRGLSREMKRAVLMALDAAGIPVDDVLRDAKARQNALDFYEVEQKKQFEAEWARKVEENRQTQAELERVKAHTWRG